MPVLGISEGGAGRFISASRYCWQRTGVGTPLSPFVQPLPEEVRHLVEAAVRAVRSCQAAGEWVAWRPMRTFLCPISAYYYYLTNIGW